MTKKLLYMMLMAAVVLTACKGQNEAEQPIVEGEGQEITLCFSMDNTLSLDERAAGAPARRLPGDPGKDDFVAPTDLYFILWVQTTGGTKMMTAVKETGLTAANWEHNGTGIYTLKDKTYKLTIPKDGQNVQQLAGGVFHVFAFASTQDLRNVGDTINYTVFSETEKTSGRTITTTSIELATLQTLTYAIPDDVSTQDAKRTFFRSIYSTALSETSHNQMATSPTIRLRHTAARLDINWECDETAHEHGLTPNSTWTLALASNIMPTSFSLFQPGNNATGTESWSETITINEGNRYNGRYVTYLPMPTTPTFTVTSDDDTDKLDGENYSKSLPLAAGSDVNFATWMRALWTIK